MRRILAVLLALLLCPAAAVAGTTLLSPVPVLHFDDSNGAPLAGGMLFTYKAGTTTKLSTFTDATGATPNPDPVILNSRGECNCWISPGTAYKFILSPSGDSDPPTNPIWTVDNVSTNPLPLSTRIVAEATTGPLAANTYQNGTSGVGATLTATANAALTVDGVAPAVGDLVLIDAEATASHNGEYVVTSAGSASTAYVLTRSTDYDQSGQIATGNLFYVTGGVSLANTVWAMTTAPPITVGTTALNFVLLIGTPPGVNGIVLNAGYGDFNGMFSSLVGFDFHGGELEIDNSGQEPILWLQRQDSLAFNVSTPQGALEFSGFDDGNIFVRWCRLEAMGISTLSPGFQPNGDNGSLQAWCAGNGGDKEIMNLDPLLGAQFPIGATIAQHIAVERLSGGPPVVSACGTSPTLDADATDSAGTITLGTGTVTSCTLTFNNSFGGDKPICLANLNDTAAVNVGSVGANATFTFAGSEAGKILSYLCIGQGSP